MPDQLDIQQVHFNQVYSLDVAFALSAYMSLQPKVLTENIACITNKPVSQLPLNQHNEYTVVPGSKDPFHERPSGL